jgi:hypothetical protein
MQKRTIAAIVGFLGAVSAAQAQSAAAKVYDGPVGMVEREIVSLAEAMPAEKYAFAPKSGEFAGVRTFEQQVKHVATTLYMIASAVQEAKMPVDAGKDENGSADIKGKEQAVKYLKDAFAYTHKAMQGITAENQLQLVKSPFGGETPRAAIANAAVWHTFDHYGQMVVYARMNAIIPPASRQQ